VIRQGNPEPAHLFVFNYGHFAKEYTNLKQGVLFYFSHLNAVPSIFATHTIKSPHRHARLLLEIAM
jgi:hypothetical protein